MDSLLRIIRLLTQRRVIVPFGFALGILFALLAFRGIDWYLVRDQLAGASPVAIVTALALVLTSAYIRSTRWRYTFVGVQISTRRLFLVENAGLGLNNISPVRLLDEPAVLTMLTLRDRVPAPNIFASVIMTRIQDLGVTLLFAVLALALEPTLTERVVPALLASAAFIVALGALLNLGFLAKRFAVVRRIPGIFSYAQAVKRMLAQKWRMTGTVGLTIAYWLVLGPMAYVLAQGMDVEISLLQATILVLGAIFFATATPGLPGAIGTFELAVVEIAGFWGVPASLGIGYGLVLHFVVFVPPVIIAFLVLPREGISMFGKTPRKKAATGSETAE